MANTKTTMQEVVQKLKDLVDVQKSLEEGNLTAEDIEKVKTAAKDLELLGAHFYERSRRSEITKVSQLLETLQDNEPDPFKAGENLVDWFQSCLNTLETSLEKLASLSLRLTNPAHRTAVDKAHEKIAYQITVYRDLKSRLSGRREQLKAYRELLTAETDLVDLNPPVELQILRMKFSTSTPEGKEAMQPKMKALEDKHMQTVSDRWDLVQHLDKRHKELSDNYGRERRTDSTVGKGQVYSLNERCANIYVPNLELSSLVEAKFVPYEQRMSNKSNAGEDNDNDEEVDENQVEDVETIVPPQCVALALVLKRAQRCAAEKNPSARNMESILKLLEQNLMDLQVHASNEDVQEVIIEGYAAQSRLNSQLDQLSNKKEMERELAKGTEKVRLPTWTGDHKDYQRWREHQVKLNRNANEDLRLAHLLNAIKNQEIKEMIQYELSFDEAIATLDKKYGNRTTFIPTVLKRLEDLKKLPTSREDESKNIQAMKNGLKELQAYHAEDRINENFITILADRVRAQTRDQWYDSLCEKKVRRGQISAPSILQLP